MVGIGIRVYSNKKIFYTIIEETKDSYNFINIDCLNIPLSLNAPDRLNYIRNTLLDILSEYKVNNAVLRVKEMVRSVKKYDIERFYVEGVLLETLSDSSVESYDLGQISTLAKHLEIDRSDFKKLSNNEMSFHLIPDKVDWAKLSKEERESILTCHAALNL